ncbi:aldehyde-activating protein [Roseivivax halodurans JCM 10272]|uniref:Aldehyde-activating protein n=1 Tax=Roseivivax halodurans JCM 10272 TaxID=1449350 RepID=X7EJN1_9RHOB|nr:GFA family protein [Roseivivax halodurans]ETX15356.1 aldehyde-activating protein [Roseivivax halodurans JCM 10272]
MMSDKTGHCLCGAVRFSARNVKRGFGACHCKMCQRWAGAAMLAVTVPADALTVEGADKVRTRQSSDWATRSWCDECGSNLWYRFTGEGADGSYEVPLGLFDDTTGFVLEQEIFVDQKSDAFELKGDHERLTKAEVIEKYNIPAS